MTGAEAAPPMFACMAGAAPQPADQRRVGDKMDPLINKLIANYSVALVEMVRNCLALDPLARPQSVFSLQKVLQAALPVTEPDPDDGKQAGWRGLVGRIGALARKPTT